MADKPSRALVLYGDGLAGFLDPSHTHLNSLASLACCGFLTLPHSPPSENEDARITREFSELLDVHGIDNSAMKAEHDESLLVKNGGIRTLSDRFMGMKAAIVTNNPSLDLGKKLGLASVPLNKLIDNKHSSPEPSMISSELLKSLGFQEGKTSDEHEFDLLFVHIGAGEEPNGLEDINHLNGLVGALLKATEPGMEISYRLHLSVLMSYRSVNGDKTSDFSLSDEKHDKNSKFSSFFPCQSYTFKGGKQRDNVRHSNPILIAQWQNGVTRKDTVKAFSFDEFKENCGNLAIPADRFIHEVAFKLWKAPKYGA